MEFSGGMKRLLFTMMFLLGTVSYVAAASERGAEIFSTQCAACHGNAGIETDAPILYGQESAYIVKSLVAFKQGYRKDRIMMVMNAIAATLSDDDIREVAVFVAGQDACRVNLKIDHRRKGFRAAFIAGRQQYVSANCAHCHQSFHHYAPRLVGQKAGFLAKALQQFKAGERKAPMMAKLLKTWTSEDFNNVVIYLSGLRLMRACGDRH